MLHWEWNCWLKKRFFFLRYKIKKKHYNGDIFPFFVFEMLKLYSSGMGHNFTKMLVAQVMDRQECCYWKRVSSGPANKRQIQSMSKPIHAFVLCSSVFAKLTLGSDKAILITGLSFWTGPLLIFEIVCLVIGGPHFAFPAVSLESISQHCHFKRNCLHDLEPPLVSISCSPGRLWSPKKRVKKQKVRPLGQVAEVLTA